MWIINAIRSGNMTQLVVGLAVRLFIIFAILPVHEFAHGWMAKKLGDNTARYQGRLTMNPLAHVDPMGALFILFFGFGWAKPVPVNPYNFKNRKRDMAFTALAGPVSNVLVAVLGAFLYYAIFLLFPVQLTQTTVYVAYFFNTFISINIGLAVFNLLPIPPLDGSRIFSAILPDKWVFKMAQYEQYIFIGLFLLMFTGVLNPVTNFFEQYVTQGVLWLASLPFRLFGLL